MYSLLIYLIKSAITLSVLYLLFACTTRGQQMHRLNRVLLLSIVGLSFVLPTFEVNINFLRSPNYFTTFPVEQYIIKSISAVGNETVEQPLTTQEAMTFNYQLLWGILPLLFVVVRLIVPYVRICQLFKKGTIANFEGERIIVVNDEIQPFSLMGRIVLSRSDFEKNAEAIIVHEREHVRLGHHFDNLILELMLVVQFVNPLAWLLRKDLKMIHEYQADASVIRHGFDMKRYQLLVLEKAVGERRFALANNFNQKPVIMRFKMMKQTTKQRWRLLTLLLFIPAVFLLLQSFSNPEMISDALNQDEEIEIDEELNMIDGEGENLYYDVLANGKGVLYVEGEIMMIDDLQAGVEAFLKSDNPKYFKKVFSATSNVRIDDDGNKAVKSGEASGYDAFQGVITYRYDTTTPEDLKEKVMDSFMKAYENVRNELANKEYKEDYTKLSEDKQKMVKAILPIKIVTSAPKNN